MAVTEWLPVAADVTARLVITNVTTPEAGTAFVPRVKVLPLNASVSVTLPVGVPAPGATGVTVTVNVIGWPATVEPAAGEPLGLAARVVAVPALLTLYTTGPP